MSLFLLLAIAFAGALLLGAIGVGIYFATRNKDDDSGE